MVEKVVQSGPKWHQCPHATADFLGACGPIRLTVYVVNGLRYGYG